MIRLGMSKVFRPWNVDQGWLLPPSIHEFVPAGHPAHVVRELVRAELDLSEIMAEYDELRGYPPHHPAMMTALLLYAYSRGVYSSRQIAQACEERLDFQAVTALTRPNFRPISEFRRRHLAALGGLFVQVLTLCQRAGLVSFGHVALDGTKIQANASKHKAMSYGRMEKAEKALSEEVARWLDRAEAADAEEDDANGPDRRGDEPPDWAKDKAKLLARIRAAKAELEAEATAQAEAKAKEPPRYRGGRKPKHPPGKPKPSTQRNFTDPESRIMKGRDGFIQAYNGQIAVDGRAQIIVAHQLTNNASDHDSLEALVDAIKANTGRKPREISADAGYCSEHNLSVLQSGKIRAYIATGRAKKPASGEGERRGPLVSVMRATLKRAGYRSRYRLRKQIVEPVFGQIKQARRYRQCLLRGIEKVANEWAFICTAHNLAKLVSC
jgi:transposase